MDLTPGTRLGRYELLGPLGAGGMGEVYRARDERLGREVAIKVLPPAFANDPDRIARFEREARVLAALVHPGIAAIYEVGEQDGRHYLVLELVPGETLAQRLRAGPLPLEEALSISRQIADALEAAHGQGIVHRDLKPANVKLTPTGKVKLLDFGLAKDVARLAPASDVSSSPTRSIGATEAGVVLGTVDYMSPEQARGKPIDKRTDIWAFGCVLYELLTRRPAFAGDTASDVIARVLTRDPDWQTLPPNTPPSVVSLLRRCLQRDLDRRLRDIGDARLEIEEALAAPSTAAPPARRPQHALSGGLALLAGISMALALWGWTRRPRASPQPVMRFAIGLPGFRINDVALSPDANRLVLDASPLDRPGGRSLFMRRLDQLEATAIPGADDDSISPFFSPDGQWLGFKKGNALFKLSLAGGAPNKICDARSGDASWGDDGTIYFHPAPGTGISRVSAAGGTPEQLTVPETQKDERGHSSPRALPRGRGVLFTIDYAHKPNSVAVHAPDAGKRILIENAQDASYVTTGHLLYRQAGKLMGVRFDLERLEVISPAVPLLEGSQYFAFAASGALAYVPESRRETERVLLSVDRKGTARPLTQTRRAFERPRFSPDGERVAVTIRGVDSPDVWIYQIKQDTLTRLTSQGRNRSPIWTPDGKRVTYVSVKAGREALVSSPADGSGGEEELFESADLEDPTSWSPDSRTLAFEQYSGHPSYYDLWLLSLADGKTAKPFLRTPFHEGGAAISPDGRWIAYGSNESGQWQVYVQPLPGPGGKQLVSTQRGVAPVWSRDGRELFYLENDTLMVADVALGPVLRVGRPRVLFKVPQEGDYDAAPDGQSFVMIKTERNFPPTEAIVVLNWLDELKRLVPAQP